MAIWDQERTRLLPIAQVYSGLTDTEIREVDAWIKGHTTEKFGPVRTVVPQLVFEIGFDGIQRSGRHKAGIALRFPRILRWRRDKLASEADDLGIAEKLLNDRNLDEDPLNEPTKQDPL
jgi:DNA ligase-1